MSIQPFRTTGARFPSKAAGLRLLLLVLAGLLTIDSTGYAQAEGQADVVSNRTVTASPLAGFHHSLVEALLYNPSLEEVTSKYPYKAETTTRKLEPTLILTGMGIEDGNYALHYRIQSGRKTLYQGAADVSVVNGLFENVFSLPKKYPEADGVAYELKSKNNGASVHGSVPLRWSRFQGRVRYLDGGWRSAYINLRPNGFASAASLYVPVADDGRFDALLPSRIYSVINVNGTGYSYDAMERWAWDYDLTRDREDEFTIGRTELYGIHAFNLRGGAPTVFVSFRPTALSRILQFDEDGDSRTTGEERKKMEEAMKLSPTVIGPVLQASDVRVWLNGKEQKIEQFNLIPEYNGTIWQVIYLLQFYPEPRPAFRVWHEIKLEVRSKETLRGKEIEDYGQGSVGFYRQ